MEKLIKTYSGQGQLIFTSNESVPVVYSINEYHDFNLDGLLVGGDRRGRISHAEGHPAWHPLGLVEAGILTLIIEDGRKLKVMFANSEGSIQASGDFF